MNNESSQGDANNGKVSVRREGVTNQIKLFFWKYPNSSAKKCCSELGLDYKKYRNLCYRIKSETRKQVQGKVQTRQLVSLSHRVEFVLSEPLRLEVWNVVNFEALRRRPKKGEVQPQDDWFIVPNRNAMRMLRNEFVTIRLYPRSRHLFVLPHKPMDWKDVKVCLQNALFKAGLDLRECELLSAKLEPSPRHRTFYIGEVTPFKIDFYKPSLGITLKADGSHPSHIEVIENSPAWIPSLLESQAKLTESNVNVSNAVNGNTEVLGKFTEQISLHLKVLEGIGESVTLLNETIKSIPKTDELAKRLERLETLLHEDLSNVVRSVHALGKLIVKRKRRAVQKKKPSRLQRLRRFLRVR